MSGSVPGSTAGNPLGLSPSMLALMMGMQGMGTAMQGGAGRQQLGYPPLPGSAWSPGQPSATQLLAQILAMRSQAAQAMGDPYQQGVAAPRVSLLGGS
jgi:hypothetical protein